MVDSADSLVCMYVEMFTAFFVPCSCQSLDTYKLASYIHSYHLPFGELRNWQYSHSVALSGHRTGELLSSRSLDSNTSLVLKTCDSPVPTEEESLKSCADEFLAICITWPIYTCAKTLYHANCPSGLAIGKMSIHHESLKHFASIVQLWGWQECLC